jgi:hypothetical protein
LAGATKVGGGKRRERNASVHLRIGDIFIERISSSLLSMENAKRKRDKNLK